VRSPATAKKHRVHHHLGPRRELSSTPSNTRWSSARTVPVSCQLRQRRTSRLSTSGARSHAFRTLIEAPRRLRLYSSTHSRAIWWSATARCAAADPAVAGPTRTANTATPRTSRSTSELMSRAFPATRTGSPRSAAGRRLSSYRGASTTSTIATGDARCCVNNSVLGDDHRD